MTKRADAESVVDDLGLSLASVRLAGALMLDADSVADGQLSFSAANLDDLSPLALARMSGALEAKISASHADGRQAVAIVADSEGMSVGANRIDGLTLALPISAANRIFVRGCGIYGELGGDPRVSGSARAPQVNAGFDLLCGSLSLLDKRLVFTRRDVRFRGNVMPDLDLVAGTSATDTTARISVTGPAAQPTFAITSNPDEEIPSDYRDMIYAATRQEVETRATPSSANDGPERRPHPNQSNESKLNKSAGAGVQCVLLVDSRVRETHGTCNSGDEA